MMISKVFSSFIFILWAVISYGQYQLSGSVFDAQQQPIEGAEVYLTELSLMTVTEPDGTFSFTEVPSGDYNLIVFAFGNKTYTQSINVSGNTNLEVSVESLGETLSEVVLTQEREKLFTLQQLRKVEGTAIYAGKKSEVVLLDNITGNLAANNPRQIYSQVVGLNIYENGDAGLQLNIGGRGLDPNRTANFNVRQNGYDISADALGYPESYYTPPAEALEEIQVVRGAASLQYGPQFGGLINFKLKQPNPSKEIEWISRQTLGSFDLRTSFNSLSGTVGDFSYYTYFNYKEGSGFRPNSDFTSRNYYGHFGYQISDKTKIAFEATLFNYLAQQPGGLTDAQFNEDPNFSNRARNWFNVDWKLFSLRLDHRFSSKTDFSLNLFTLDAERNALGFRINRIFQDDVPTEPREFLLDEFQNWGAEARLLTRYKLKGKDAVFLVGSKYYQTNNNQQQGPGTANSNADFSFATETFPDYERQSQFEFPNLNLALFAENIFNLSDKFSITPGFRFEYIKTESMGSFQNIVTDLASNVLLNEAIPDNRDFERSFILFGLGTSYKVNPAMEWYGNFSQNYRSVTFNDIRVVNPSFQIDENITDETGFTADTGIRGQWKNYLNYDVSVFGLLYDDRIGEVVAQETRLNAAGELVTTGRLVRLRGNIGTAFMYGLETFADVNLKEVLFKTSDQFKLNYFVNVALTKSEYTDALERENIVNGIVEGKEVEFVPAVNLKTGLNFGYADLLGSVQFSYLSEQFTDATNAEPNFGVEPGAGIVGTIPAYEILDVSLSYTYKKFRLEAGINNVLDKSFFTRRATGYPGPGIIPAEPRTFYTTLQFKL